MSDPLTAFVVGLVIGVLLTFGLTVYVVDIVVIELRQRPMGIQAATKPRKYPPVPHGRVEQPLT